jgi:aminomethyltransferase
VSVWFLLRSHWHIIKDVLDFSILCGTTSNSIDQAFSVKKMRGGGLWQLGQSITRRLAQADKKTVARRYFSAEAELKKTVLHDFHVAHGGKMVPFAGWSMPIQYKDSIMDSTLNCRQHGGLFDVSHMCGLSLKGKDCVTFLEKLVIADVAGLAHGTGTLTVFTNEKGGAIDDSVITKVKDDHIYLVVNAGCRDKDLAHIEEHMKAFKAKGGDVSWHIHDERSLLALQVSPRFSFQCFPMS